MTRPHAQGAVTSNGTTRSKASDTTGDERYLRKRSLKLTVFNAQRESRLTDLSHGDGDDSEGHWLLLSFACRSAVSCIARFISSAMRMIMCEGAQQRLGRCCVVREGRPRCSASTRARMHGGDEDFLRTFCAQHPAHIVQVRAIEQREQRSEVGSHPLVDTTSSTK